MHKARLNGHTATRNPSVFKKNFLKKKMAEKKMATKSGKKYKLYQNPYVITAEVLAGLCVSAGTAVLIWWGVTKK